ncbi:MAG: thioesterase family protein [Pseudomonadota bacterium]
MNLFFRRLWIILTAMFASKNGPLDKVYQRTYRVWLTDQDMFMHMTNSRYLSFSDLGRLNLLIRSGLSKALKQNGWRLEICAQTRTITRMLKAPQAFRMICEIDGWTDQHIAFNHMFKRGRKTHATVNTLMRISDGDGNQVSPQRLIDAVRWAQSSPKMPQTFIDLATELQTTPP